MVNARISEISPQTVFNSLDLWAALTQKVKFKEGKKGRGEEDVSSDTNSLSSNLKLD